MEEGNVGAVILLLKQNDKKIDTLEPHQLARVVYLIIITYVA